MEKMERCQEQMDRKLDSLVTYLKGGNGVCAAAVKKEEVDDKFVVSSIVYCHMIMFDKLNVICLCLSIQVNGVNLLRIHSTGPYAYALRLLDIHSH